ncbi:hypothetical protein [Desulfomonile tiedjei]|uniref:Nickel transport protein n=1 Tax=Desulfomonile tiedjei (strain ATCC 49306 / DSM 6799 / DCB-1) TaxID=706587 RepID=I4CDD0_DESTA|nr:hypothetical protein [Desulfomonile tiedjei]AFM27571.1 hypothetical protein Desti_4957 [Desulfomonile tiedjei DSM 6799]
MNRITALKAILMGTILLCLSGVAHAHKPLLSVGDNQDGTIAIEAGFSDGSSAAGHKIILKEEKTDAVISEHRVGEDGTLQLKKPNVPYTVTLDAGEGHIVVKAGPAPGGSETETAAAKSEVESLTPAAESTVKTSPVQQAQPMASSVELSAAAQPVRVAQVSTEISPGVMMAFKMMITAQIVTATALIILLAALAYFAGYTVGKRNAAAQPK